jgi:hydrogenase expression/formation protein HypC
MCLAVPARICRIESASEALVEMGGVRKRISVELIDAPREGEFVIVHVGYALSKVDAIEAERTLALMAAEGLVGEVAGATGAAP